MNSQNMEISKRKFALTIVLLLIMGMASGYAISQIEVVTVKKQTTLKANVFLVYELFDGKTTLEVPNAITNIGENETRDRFSENCTTTDYALYWISIGNVSGTLTTKTQLDSQYKREKGSIAEWTNAGDSALNCTYKFQFTETQNINGAGWHWDGTGNNNMYAVANFPTGAQTFINGENLTIRWIGTYNGN